MTAELCSDCPPEGHPTNKTRCEPCPRRGAHQEGAVEKMREDAAQLARSLAEARQEAGEAVALAYTNYRGETAVRTIIPKSVRYGSTEWHPEPQWLLLAYDVEKQADREFALKDFGSPAPGEGLRAALDKRRSYNVDIRDGKINYRPEDHIAVIVAAAPAPPVSEEGQ